MPFVSITAFALSFLCLFTTSDKLYKGLYVQVEYSRKLVHIGSGLLVLLFPQLLDLWSVALLCSSFLAILIWSKRHHKLSGINDVARRSFGSECYPIAVFVCFLVYKITQQSAYFYLPISIMAFADPMAAIVGKLIASPKLPLGDKQKTVAGFLTFFIVALICCVAVDIGCDVHLTFIVIVLVALIAAITELISRHGLDNIFIPIVVLFVLWLSSY